MASETQQRPSRPIAVSLQQIALSFGTHEVLKDVNLTIHEGERIAILGSGGCGKSSLLKMMLGLFLPSRGKIEIFGHDIFAESPKKRREILQQIGMAFQQGALFDFMTVRENIRFALENMTTAHEIEMEERIASMLQDVNLPTASAKLPSDLSGGMRRRVGIVRALATDPKLALLDEPTAGLDPVTSTIVIDMIHKLAQNGQSTLVCVTSSVEVAFTFASRVAILKDGKIIGDGNWKELHECNDPWINHFLDVRGFEPKPTEILQGSQP